MKQPPSALNSLRNSVPPGGDQADIRSGLVNYMVTVAWTAAIGRNVQ